MQTESFPNSNQPKEEHLMSDEMSIFNGAEYRQVSYARLFAESFRDRFDAAAAIGETSYTMTKREFDEWLVSHGLVTEGDRPYFHVPTPGTADWTHFVQKRNQRRDQINAASSVGEHGEPPYRIDIDGKERLRVQLLTGMVLVTHRDAAEAIKSLAGSKLKDAAKYTEFFRQHQHELPPEVRYTLDHQHSLISMAAGTVADAMNRALAELQKTYESTVVLLESRKQAALPAPNVEEVIES